VPVVTLPSTTRPPEAMVPHPPAANIPYPPQLNQQGGMWTNAFTPPEAMNPSMSGGQGAMMVPAYPTPAGGYGPYAPSGYGRPGMAMPPASPYGPVSPGMYPAPMAAPMPPVSMNPAVYGPGQGLVQAGFHVPPDPGFMPANQPLTGMPSGQPVPQLVGMLKDSLYPSQREWAADCLTSCDWRTHPEVVQALVAGASKDPAATVRAGCVRALAKMNVNTPPVLSAIWALKADADPRVTQEAEQALAGLSPSK